MIGVAIIDPGDPKTALEMQRLALKKVDLHSALPSSIDDVLLGGIDC